MFAVRVRADDWRRTQRRATESNYIRSSAQNNCIHQVHIFTCDDGDVIAESQCTLSNRTCKVTAFDSGQKACIGHKCVTWRLSVKFLYCYRRKAGDGKLNAVDLLRKQSLRLAGEFSYTLLHLYSVLVLALFLFGRMPWNRVHLCELAGNKHNNFALLVSFLEIWSRNFLPLNFSFSLISFSLQLFRPSSEGVFMCSSLLLRCL